MSNTVPCSNPAHGVKSHIVGTQAATDCAKGATTTFGRSPIPSTVPSSNSVAPFIPRARRSTLNPENRAHLDTLESGKHVDVIIGRVGDSDIVATVNFDEERDIFAHVDTAGVTSMNMHGGRTVGAYDFGGFVKGTLSDGSEYKSAWGFQYMDTDEDAAGDMTREEVEALIKAADYVSDVTFADSVDTGNAATEIMNALQDYQPAPPSRP